jgi:cation:H+ antiporter
MVDLYPYLFLSVGLALLAWGGCVLVDGAVDVAKKMHVSSLLIGLTLVGFGTSTPELLTSLRATMIHSPGIALGNVVGSNIANILLVLGIAAVIHPVHVEQTAFNRDGFFLLLSTVVLMGVSFFSQTIGFLVGAVMTALLIFYVFYSYKMEKTHPTEEHSASSEVQTEKETSLFVNLLKTVLGIGMTIFGAELLVQNAVTLARIWKVSESVIGLTIVAVGTSLPELATSAAASFKKQNAIAFGNVVGSNIYNALFILGVTAVFLPVHIPQDSSKESLYVMAGVTLLLLFLGKVFRKIGRAWGVVFLLFYGVYVVCLIK